MTAAPKVLIILVKENTPTHKNFLHIILAMIGVSQVFQ